MAPCGRRVTLAGGLGCALLALVVLAVAAACDVGGGAGASGTGGAGGVPGSGGAGSASDTGGSGGAYADTGTPGPSCDGLAATCGPAGDEDCCASLTVPGGSFPMGRGTAGPDAYASGEVLPMGLPELPMEVPEHTVTVSGFRLDKFEVTVGRFLKFLAAGSPEPASGAGKHGYLTGGNETGWDTAWSVASPTAPSSCNLDYPTTWTTWTSSAGANENMAMNCLNWYTAQAFCIWDGGFLPTEAEWEYAAAGGGENRLYPWGATAPDRTLANFVRVYESCPAADEDCAGRDLDPVAVGHHAAGNGRWGHADLAGNVYEWVSDWYDSGWYSGAGGTCNDCANFTCNDCTNVDGLPNFASTSARVLRGGSFAHDTPALRAASRNSKGPSGGSGYIGVRCARTEWP